MLRYFRFVGFRVVFLRVDIESFCFVGFLRFIVGRGVGIMVIF